MRVSEKKCARVIKRNKEIENSLAIRGFEQILTDSK